MSRIGKKLIPIPDKVKVSVKNRKVFVEGPKGKLDLEYHDTVDVDIKDDSVAVKVKGEDDSNRAFQGLTRSLINNMVTGVSQGFTRGLSIQGIGYRANVKGNSLMLSLGYSHPIELIVPDDIAVKVDKNVNLEVSGIDKQKVGHFASLIRAQRKPEPFKGKGVRYKDEFVKRKAGKSAAK